MTNNALGEAQPERGSGDRRGPENVGRALVFSRGVVIWIWLLEQVGKAMSSHPERWRESTVDSVGGKRGKGEARLCTHRVRSP